MVREKIKGISLSINEISEKAAKQEDCIRLDIGQPSFDTPQHVKDFVEERIDERQSYTNPKGIEKLREKIAEEENMKEGMDISKENVLVTVGGMGALYIIMTSYLKPDDKVVLNDPCWGPYKLLSAVNGNRFEQLPYFVDGELNSELEEELEEAELIIINSPNNPTGKVHDQQEIEELCRVAEKTETVLVSDEVYNRLDYTGEFETPYGEYDDTLVVGSTSKNHAMTGWRIGWLVADEDLINEMVKTARAMTACPPRASQYAAIKALEEDIHVKEMREEYEKRRETVYRRCKDLGWYVEEPEGGIYIFPDIGKDSWSFCRKMVEEGVAIVPGAPMGETSNTNVRICFGSSSVEEINEAFDRIEESM